MTAMSLVFAYICDVMRKRVAYELYNSALSIEDNAAMLGCSVASLRKHFSQKGIDRRYDVQYRRWQQVNRYYRDNPESSLRTASAELHCSINTVRKYRAMTEDEFRVSIRVHTSVITGSCPRQNGSISPASTTPISLYSESIMQSDIDLYICKK